MWGFFGGNGDFFITLISEFGENNFFNVSSGKDGVMNHALPAAARSLPSIFRT